MGSSRSESLAWSVEGPAVVWAVSVAVTLGGAVSFTRLALATKTEVELPRLTISGAWSGASPELVEMYLSSPVEAAVQAHIASADPFDDITLLAAGRLT